MDRPGIDKPIIGSEKEFRCVGRTQNLDEADRIAEQYRMQGYETQIIKKMQAGLAIYEIWIGKEPEILK